MEKTSFHGNKTRISLIALFVFTLSVVFSSVRMKVSADLSLRRKEAEVCKAEITESNLKEIEGYECD